MGLELLLDIVQQEEKAVENDVYDQLLVPDVAIEDNEEKTFYPTEKKVEISRPTMSGKVISNFDDYNQEDITSCEFKGIICWFYEWKRVCHTLKEPIESTLMDSQESNKTASAKR